MDASSSFQSFSSLLIYFASCGLFFLVLVCVFCFYKNYRTLRSTEVRTHTDSVALPALPEADLYLVDLVRHVYGYSDRELRQDVGVEGWMYMNFHRDVLRVVGVMTAAAATVLLPTYLSAGSWTDIGSYSLLSIQGRRRLQWIPLGALLLFTGALVLFLFQFSSKVKRELLRAEGGVAARTLEVANFPVQTDVKAFATVLEEAIRAQLRPSLDSPEAVQAVEVVPDLNTAYTVLLQLKKALQLRKYYLEVEETEGQAECRVSLCSSVPAVPHFSALVKSLQSQYRAAASLHHQSLGVAFVTLRSRALLLHVLCNFKSETVPAEYSPQSWRLRKAPNPKEILWENLTRRKTSRLWAANVLFLVLFFIVLTPFAFQQYIEEVIGFLHLTPVLQNYLTPVFIYIYQQLVLKRTVLGLVHLERHSRASHAAVSVFYKYYVYSLVYSFLLPMLGIQTLHIVYQWLLVAEQAGWRSVVGAAVNSSGFVFTQVVISHCFVSNGLDLLQHSKYIKAVFRAALARLPQDKVRAFEAEHFPFGSAYAETTGVLLTVAAYAVVYPLILPFGLLYFLLRVSTRQLAVQKYNLLCFYVVTFDSYGRVAKQVATSVAVAVFFMQLVTLGVLMLNGSDLFYALCSGLALVACAQLPLTLLVASLRNRNAHLSEGLEGLGTDQVSHSYLHPCLRPSDLLS